MPKITRCYTFEHGAFPIHLERQGKDRFTVVYGLQVKKDLDYGEAAMELGSCIMHTLACEGKLDNRR